MSDTDHDSFFVKGIVGMMNKVSFKLLNDHEILMQWAEDVCKENNFGKVRFEWDLRQNKFIALPPKEKQ